MAAQGYQESRLDQDAKSRVGAIGVMQLMPETGKEQKVGDIRKLEPNIHAGVKYMRFIRDSFFEDEPMDDLNKGLFTFAAYNAGPGRSGSCARKPTARARSERLVRQRRADRLRADRPRDGDLRQQHLQVLRRLQAGDRRAAAQEGGGRAYRPLTISPSCWRRLTTSIVEPLDVALDVLGIRGAADARPRSACPSTGRRPAFRPSWSSPRAPCRSDRRSPSRNPSSPTRSRSSRCSRSAEE